jgi:hypothetical protein
MATVHAQGRRRVLSGEVNALRGELRLRGVEGASALGSLLAVAVARRGAQGVRVAFRKNLGKLVSHLEHLRRQSLYAGCPAENVVDDPGPAPVA